MPISFKVTGQKLSPMTDVFIASKTLNYPDLIFEFDEEWLGFGKVATFKTSNSDIYYISINEDRCIIPAEVMLDNEMISIGVYGTKGTVRITTNVINILCHKSGYGKGIAPSEQSVDLITQLQQDILKIKEDYLSKEQFREQLREFTVQVIGAKCITNYSGTWLKPLSGFRIAKADYNPSNNDVMVIWANNEILTPGTDYTLVEGDDYWEVASYDYTTGLYLTVQIWHIPQPTGTIAGAVTSISDSVTVSTVAGTADVITEEDE